LHFIDLTGYYRAALRHFPSDTHFYVFTNDRGYAERQEWLSSIPHTFVECDEVTGLAMMKGCTLGGICSNSTYAWWGAALAPSRVLVLPSRWMNTLEQPDYRIPGCIVEEVGISASCIHLPHRTDRMASIARMQARYPWLQVHLVDAIHVPEAGWKGCLRSHQAIVQSAKEARLPYVLVLEDDCEFRLESEDLKRALLAAIEYTREAPVISGCGNLVRFDGVSVVGQRSSLRFLKAPDVRTTHCILYASSSYDRVLAMQETDEIDVQLNACGLVFTYPYLAAQAASYSDIQQKDVSYENIERSRAFVKNLVEPLRLNQEPPRLQQNVQQPVNLRPVFRIPIRTKRV
jgi:GR25 family glycosyltransferase involved in LPS biosynthesis